MSPDVQVVLDACVLAPMPLADTLFRLAETPRLHLPRWSDNILGEVASTLTGKLGLSMEQARYREGELRKHFPEAWVHGYEPLIPAMTNDAKDRHVLAATVRCGAELIVTYNQRHFPADALTPCGIDCLGPSTFLGSLYDADPKLINRKLHEQAENIDLGVEELLARLRSAVPGFVSHLLSELPLDAPPRKMWK